MFQEPTEVCASCNIPTYHLIRDGMCEECCVHIDQNDWDELFHAITSDALMELSFAGDSELEEHIAGIAAQGQLDLTFNHDVFDQVIDVDDDDDMSDITLDEFAEFAYLDDPRGF
jgi:hypothetical protein